MIYNYTSIFINNQWRICLPGRARHNSQADMGTSLWIMLISLGITCLPRTFPGDKIGEKLFTRRNWQKTSRRYANARAHAGQNKTRIAPGDKQDRGLLLLFPLGTPAGLKAFTAVNGTIIARLKGHLCDSAALGAHRFIHLPRRLILAPVTGAFPGHTAFTAAGRFIFKPLLRIEGLFTRREHKFLPTLLAPQGLVLISQQNPLATPVY